jgi:hypothetical protein
MITTTTAKKASNKELLNLHYRIHQLHRLGELKRIKIDMEMLKEKHSIIASEMTSRKIRHTTSLEQAMEALF